jgi:hypothetical protein
MIAAWERQKELLPRYRNIIDMGIEKLTDYVEEIEEIPAYTLAIRTYEPSSNFKKLQLKFQQLFRQQSS